MNEDDVKNGKAVMCACCGGIYQRIVPSHLKRCNTSIHTIQAYLQVYPNATILTDDLRKRTAVTLKNLIGKHGHAEGTDRWRLYRERQAYTNTYKYKQEKHGMSKEEYDIFNKSRSVTLEHMISKHGHAEGTDRWNVYCDRQAYTNTLPYFIEKYGKDGYSKWKLVNSKKAHTLANYTERHGKKAADKLAAFFQKSTTFYSKSSQLLFKALDVSGNDELYYATLDDEYGIMAGDRYLKYDFVCIRDGEKYCIEFNGDVFHANPSIYSANDQPNPYTDDTSLEIWEFDKMKTDAIINEGFKLLIVWESDYSNNPDAVIDQCNEFLRGSI